MKSLRKLFVIRASSVLGRFLGLFSKPKFHALDQLIRIYSPTERILDQLVVACIEEILIVDVYKLPQSITYFYM